MTAALDAVAQTLSLPPPRARHQDLMESRSLRAPAALPVEADGDDGCGSVDAR